MFLVNNLIRLKDPDPDKRGGKTPPVCSALAALPALLAQFGHDLRDVNIGGHLGLLLLLLLPEDDGAETGPPLLCVLLQLGITGEPKIRIMKKDEEKSSGD